MQKSIRRPNPVFCRTEAGPIGSLSSEDDCLQSGNVVEEYEYDVYGSVWVSSLGQTWDRSQVGNPYLFTGRRYDPETGLYYCRARMYSPDLGRFLQTDPIGYADAMNLYQYCLNNPVNWIDPWGLARFGVRPLSDGNAPIVMTGPLSSLFNIEAAHEHLFFEDEIGGNIGLGPDGRFSEDPRGRHYRMRGKHYDDALMRQAVQNVEDGDYSLLGWGKGVKKNNCQDWASRVRKEYKRLEKEKEKKGC